MLRKVLLPLLVLLLVTITESNGQNDLLGQEKDFEIWTSINLEKEFLKDFEVELEGAYRLEENVTRTKAILGKVGLTYKYKKWLRIKANYRIANRIDEIEHRLNGDLLLRAEINRFQITLRNRFQREWIVNINPKDFFRERLKLSYNIRKFPLDPYIAGEAWYRFSNIENQFEELRADFGMQWNITNRSELELFYRGIREVNENNPQRTYVLGIEFTYSFD